MKSIRVHRFGGPEVLAYEDVAEPEVGPADVLVRLHAAGVNPVDTYIRSGTYARKPALPYTPGTDGGGIVVRVGAQVTRLAEGQRVYVAATLDETFGGTYREYTTCGEAFVHPIPDRISFAQAAAVGVPYSTAYRALVHKAQAKPGETVFVHGASGGVGLATLQLARAFGVTVIASAGSARGRALLAEQGAQHVVDHGREGYLDEVIRLTAGRGVDAVIEMLANVNLGKDLTLLGMRGRVVVVGSRGDVQITPRLTMAKDATVMGLALWNTSREDMQRIHAALVAGLAAGYLTPVVARELPLADAAAAHEAVLAPGAHGKIVLTPRHADAGVRESS